MELAAAMYASVRVLHAAGVVHVAAWFVTALHMAAAAVRSLVPCAVRSKRKCQACVFCQLFWLAGRTFAESTTRCEWASSNRCQLTLACDSESY